MQARQHVRKRTSKRSESAAALLGTSALHRSWTRSGFAGKSALRRSSPGSSTIEWHALALNAALAATGMSCVSRASSSPAGSSRTEHRRNSSKVSAHD